MAAVTIPGMRAAETAALANGWTEERLLGLAGEQLGCALGRFFPHPGTMIAYLGKGHNAGDALVALRVLRDRFHWRIATRNAFQIEDFAHLTLKKWQELGLAGPLESQPKWRNLQGPLVLLDGLTGIGGRRPLNAAMLALASEMEWLRNNAGARVAAVDVPSGIDTDSGEMTPGCVRADITFMIGNAKRGLLSGTAANTVGALSLVPVEPLTSTECGDADLVSPQTMTFGKTQRPFDFHKGMAGHVALVAGSNCYSGAAVLAATGAVRGGAGLVTLYVPPNTAGLIASKCPPEVIVRPFSSSAEIQDSGMDSLVVGCGIGKPDSTGEDELLKLIADSVVPTVVDADALNLLARRRALGILNARHVVTPHPGEFRRLAPKLADRPRESAARAFVEMVPATLVLKGCRTIIARRDAPLWCNATGSPAMATGGQGDLLAGLIGARLAFQDPPHEAAALAAWICGRAAEIALGNDASEESLTPTDVAQNLGRAFQSWKTSER